MKTELLVAHESEKSIARHADRAPVPRVKCERYRSLIENIPDVVWSVTTTGVITFVSSKIERLSGYRADEILSADATQWLTRAHPEDAPQVARAFVRLQRTREPLDVEFRWQRKDGRWLRLRGRAIEIYQQGDTTHVDGLLSDITDKAQTEDQMRALETLETVGAVTDGVAHDFNNVLSAILAYNQFLLESLEDDDPRRSDAIEVREAASRGAALTRQLLSLGRPALAPACSIHIETVVAGFEKMLRRLIGSRIMVEVASAKNLPAVLGDSAQIERVVLNLAVNARDAMPNGGTLRIDASSVEVTHERAAADGTPIPPGGYVRLSVSDTGTGIDPAIRKRIFEPFFTTKTEGKGTGLGLWTCLRLIRQAHGFVQVESAPGGGTTFHVYFPHV